MQSKKKETIFLVNLLFESLLKAAR